jgi:hypothetical protein
MTPINQLSMVDVGETNGPNPIITRNGAEVLECFYGDGIWQIEHWGPPPPPSACAGFKHLLRGVAKKH